MDEWCSEVLVLQNYLFAYALMFGYYKYRQPGRSVGEGEQSLYARTSTRSWRSGSEWLMQ